MKLIKYILLGVFLILTAFSLFAQTAQAQSPESFGLTLQQTLPGNPNYKFKRLKEKIKVIFKFSKQSKFDYREELLEKRLSELVSLVESKNANEIANSTQRFAYQAGKLAEGSYNDKSSDRKKEIIDLFGKYKPILDQMRDNFPANSPFWLLSQHDINTLDILTDRLK